MGLPNYLFAFLSHKAVSIFKTESSGAACMTKMAHTTNGHAKRPDTVDNACVQLVYQENPSIPRTR